jgi:hypothetical protein
MFDDHIAGNLRRIERPTALPWLKWNEALC